MLAKIFDKTKINIIKVILLIAFLVYLFFIGNHFLTTSTMVNIAEITKDILSGDLLLSKWDLSYSSNLFTQVFFFIIPVMFCGVSLKAISISLFLIVAATIFTGALLLKDNIKEITFKDIILYICLFGCNLVALKTLQYNGACLPFVFLVFLFANKFLKTENNKYLIYSSVIGAFLAFGDIFSVLICFAPIILYCLISIFFKEHPIKYIKLLLFTIISLLLGVFLYSQYLHFNSSGAMYQWFTTKTFIDDYTNIANITNTTVFIKRFSEIQDMSFFAEYLFSSIVLEYIFRTILTLIGIVVIFKNVINVCRNKDENDDIISFCLSGAILLIIFLSLFLEANLREYAYYTYAIIPVGIALIIMRQYNCFNKLNLFQYSTLFIITALMFIAYCPKDFKQEIALSKYPIINKILLQKDLQFGYGNYEDSAILSILSDGKINIAPIINNLPYNALLKKNYFDEDHEFYLISLYELDEYEKLLIGKSFYKITVDNSIITVLNNK